VLGAHDGPGEVKVELDGEPIASADSGTDVRGGAVRVTDQRLYRLVDLAAAGRHALTLRFDPGVSGYAFTFG
jgi:Thioredoxin like C-terminal domain